MAELRRILYVEDEPDIQAVARLSLEMVGGFEVRICSSGHEALSAVGEYLPDIILLDVMMPELDGPATLAELKKRPDAAAIPVVFMTAKVQPHEIAGYKALGVAAVIPKPFDPMTLPQQIQSIWQSARAD